MLNNKNHTVANDYKKKVWMSEFLNGYRQE